MGFGRCSAVPVRCSCKGITPGSGQPVKETIPWHCLNFPCVNCSKAAPISATASSVGKPQDGALHLWRSATTSTSSDLEAQTVPLLHTALVALRETAASGGRILFVGTKRQAQEPIAAAAKRCAQYYMNQRWLGGTLTNWQTISHSDKAPAHHRGDPDRRAAVRPHQEGIAGPLARAGQAGKSRWAASRKWAACPIFLFVIDTNKEAIAISEAKKHWAFR